MDIWGRELQAEEMVQMPQRSSVLGTAKELPKADVSRMQWPGKKLEVEKQEVEVRVSEISKAFCIIVIAFVLGEILATGPKSHIIWLIFKQNHCGCIVENRLLELGWGRQISLQEAVRKLWEGLVVEVGMLRVVTFCMYLGNIASNLLF